MKSFLVKGFYLNFFKKFKCILKSQDLQKCPTSVDKSNKSKVNFIEITHTFIAICFPDASKFKRD